jgi:hypothetical protein
MYDRTDEEIARELEDIDSPQHLYERIREDGHPICPKCGVTYVDETHCAIQTKHSAGRSGNGNPRGQELGELEPLPPAEEAIFLLRQPIDTLMRSLEKLRGRKDWLQNRRFVAEVESEGRRKGAGARWFPQKPLTHLIAVFALVEGVDNLGMYKLLAKLHPSEQIPSRGDYPYEGAYLPDPQKVDLEGLRNQTENLRNAAGNIARIVRGEWIGKGRPSNVYTRIYAGVRYAQGRAAEGASREVIRQELNERMDRGPLPFLNPDYTDQEVRQMLAIKLDTET